jgi:leader peptidase (prepilin peptidase)/N-methyltransferase
VKGSVKLDSPLRLAAVAVAIGLVAACFLVLDSLGDELVGAAGCLVLVAVTVTDLERRIIPNRIIVPALGAALVARTALDPSLRWLLAALGVGGIIFVIAVIYPAGMGMGDVKLTAFLGAWLGWQALTALFLGLLASFVPAVVILVLRGKAARKVGLPFAPFLAIGGVTALLAGAGIVDWYRSLGR